MLTGKGWKLGIGREKERERERERCTEHSLVHRCRNEDGVIGMLITV